MVSAIIMAGYNKRELEDYEEQLVLGYNEKLMKCYKPLKEFRTDRRNWFIRLIMGLFGKRGTYKPSIQFTIENMEKVDSVDDIVIVGLKSALEARLEGVIANSKKKITIVHQNEELSDKLVDEFNIDPSTPTDSLCGNAIKAYAVSNAYQKRDYAFFTVSDSPTTTAECIEYFIDEARKYAPDAGIVFPIAAMKERPSWRKIFHRKYGFLINDTTYQFDDSYTKMDGKREGFRLSSMVYANPSMIDVNKVNQIYNMRKALSPIVLKRINNFLTAHDVHFVWKKYFLSKDLSVTDLQTAVERSICINDNKAVLMPIGYVGSSYDFDMTRSDEIGVQKMIDNGLI